MTWIWQNAESSGGIEKMTWIRQKSSHALFKCVSFILLKPFCSKLFICRFFSWLNFKLGFMVLFLFLLCSFSLSFLYFTIMMANKTMAKKIFFNQKMRKMYEHHNGITKTKKNNDFEKLFSLNCEIIWERCKMCWVVGAHSFVDSW